MIECTAHHKQDSERSAQPTDEAVLNDTLLHHTIDRYAH